MFSELYWRFPATQLLYCFYCLDPRLLLVASTWRSDCCTLCTLARFLRSQPTPTMWETTLDPASGRTFWYDREKELTSWSKPPNFDEQQNEKKAKYKEEQPVLP